MTTNPSSSQPQGWDGPGWWDKPGEPQRKSASSVPADGLATAGKAGVLAAIRANSRGWLKRRLAAPVSARFVIGFALGLFGALFLAGAAVFGLWRAYDGKIMPGVHAGSVDLSGLTRTEAISKLDSAYEYLGQGKVVLTTPGGTGTITYLEAGRGPDSAAMAKAAIALGRADNPLASIAETIRIFTGGSTVPVMVKLDPLTIETRLRQLIDASMVQPKDAQIAIVGVDHEILPAAAGRGIDENVIATELIDRLFSTDAPAELQLGGKFVTIEPNVSDADAQAAAASVGKMSVAVTLTNGDKTWTIDAGTLHSWIIFGVRTNGTYSPAVNAAPIKTFVSTLAKDINVDPVEPNVIYKADQPNGLTEGRPGKALDVDATAWAIEVYLDALGSGGSTNETNLAVVVNDIPPKLAGNPSLAGFVRIGSWATTYFAGESNGDGANIQVPAQLLNGMVIGPGQQFSFLNAVGPIDEAHGFKMGGVILNGKSNHTGAIGGGICSASTTYFNAAARAGLQIDERHAHFYYVNRYPVGLDATVFSNGSTTWDMRWTNDTEYPIVIRSWWAGSRTRVINVELWSLPIGRTTTFSGGVKTNVVKANDGTQYVPSLPAGQNTYRKEYPTDGYDTVVTRTVKDSTGAVIHTDRWVSHYSRVDGLLQIAGSPPPSSTPTPTPTPTPEPTPTPGPTPTPEPTPTPGPTPTPPPTPGPPTPPPATPPPTPAPTPTPTPPRRRSNRGQGRRRPAHGRLLSRLSSAPPVLLRWVAQPRGECAIDPSGRRRQT